MATINVALIGQGFMGRSHSNAWGQVAKFFKPPLTPVMHTVFGQPEENPPAFADNWGWKNASTDWEQLVRSPEIGLVDVVTPNYMHAPVARAAIAAGKPVRLREADRRLAGRRPRDGRGRQGRQGQDLRLVQLPPLPGRGAWPINWSRRASSARSATCGRPTCRTGPASRCRCCGGSTRTWPAPAPTAT